MPNYPIKCTHDPNYVPTVEELCCGQMAVNTHTGCIYVKKCDDNVETIIQNCPQIIQIGCCTDPVALNYNPECDYDDGSCIYPSDLSTPVFIQDPEKIEVVEPRKLSIDCPPVVCDQSLPYIGGGGGGGGGGGDGLSQTTIFNIDNIFMGDPPLIPPPPPPEDGDDDDDIPPNLKEKEICIWSAIYKCCDDMELNIEDCNDACYPGGKGPHTDSSGNFCGWMGSDKKEFFDGVPKFEEHIECIPENEWPEDVDENWLLLITSIQEDTWSKAPDNFDNPNEEQDDDECKFYIWRSSPCDDDAPQQQNQHIIHDSDLVTMLIKRAEEDVEFVGLDDILAGFDKLEEEDPDPDAEGRIFCVFEITYTCDPNDPEKGEWSEVSYVESICAKNAAAVKIQLEQHDLTKVPLVDIGEWDWNLVERQEAGCIWQKVVLLYEEHFPDWGDLPTCRLSDGQGKEICSELDASDYEPDGGKKERMLTQTKCCDPCSWLRPDFPTLAETQELIMEEECCKFCICIYEVEAKCSETSGDCGKTLEWTNISLIDNIGCKSPPFDDLTDKQRKILKEEPKTFIHNEEESTDEKCVFNFWEYTLCDDNTKCSSGYEGGVCELSGQPNTLDWMTDADLKKLAEKYDCGCTHKCYCVWEVEYECKEEMTGNDTYENPLETGWKQWGQGKPDLVGTFCDGINCDQISDTGDAGDKLKQMCKSNESYQWIRWDGGSSSNDKCVYLIKVPQECCESCSVEGSGYSCVDNCEDKNCEYVPRLPGRAETEKLVKGGACCATKDPGCVCVWKMQSSGESKGFSPYSIYHEENSWLDAWFTDPEWDNTYCKNDDSLDSHISTLLYKSPYEWHYVETGCEFYLWIPFTKCNECRTGKDCELSGENQVDSANCECYNKFRPSKPTGQTARKLLTSTSDDCIHDSTYKVWKYEKNKDGSCRDTGWEEVAKTTCNGGIVEDWDDVSKWVLGLPQNTPTLYGNPQGPESQGYCVYYAWTKNLCPGEATAPPPPPDDGFCDCWLVELPEMSDFTHVVVVNSQTDRCNGCGLAPVIEWECPD